MKRLKAELMCWCAIWVFFECALIHRLYQINLRMSILLHILNFVLELLGDNKEIQEVC